MLHHLSNEAPASAQQMSTIRVGAPLYEDKWPNAKAVHVAVMAVKVYSPTAIALVLNEGTTRNQISGMMKH